MIELFNISISNERVHADEVATLQTLKIDKKLQIYRNLRGKKVKIGKKVHYMPESVELQIYEDDNGMLHFPVLILYDEYNTTDFV